jgi:uncharacterized protein (DUF427 family)
MKARLKDRVIAESDDIVAEGGYHYFPLSVVRMELKEKAPKTESTTPARMAFSSTTW